ncbi:ABC transporter ATP-binding protein [Paenibacillus endoradicis]|uniref:ABC transporter ATP-binding protein n=1 Tax=Paenibacillus endoradicis TaxID=2972487 RepID=UPI0021598977|nr:ABC transporter ATP-binding protein [Paenibacillus endoradicis]MCR8657680.1 ABC transporter ATP-binding protein [Paenibacillus endoradicis]
MEYIIETKQLSKSFGKERAVSGMNMTIRQGEIYGFLGPNGAGKTTTIRMLLGLMKASSGSIQIFGKDIMKNKLEILRNIGSLVENPSYYPHLTAHENLEVIRKVINVPKARIDEVLEIVRLSDVKGKKVKGFSLGMKQRLGIAAALLHQPKLLILDEPTNGLDPAGIIEIRELIKSLPVRYGMTVLISSHLLSEIDQMATSVGVVSKGELVFQDSIGQMRQIAKAKIIIQCSNVVHASQLLKGIEIPLEVVEDSIHLLEPTDECVANVVSTLVHEGHQVYRVEEVKRSLEEIFLQMTEKGQRR